MQPREEIDRQAKLLERAVITSGEFFDRAWKTLNDLPAQERREVLNALAGHSDDRVRDEAVKLQTCLRHEELSKDFSYVQEHSPLRSGERLELFGGYDYHSSGGHPDWLNGREYYTATFIRFADTGGNTIPVAFVEFDERIDVSGHTGKYGILRSSFGSHSFAWGEREGTVAVHVVEVLPDDVEAFLSVRARKKLCSNLTRRIGL